jgi:predicted dehydrogenase
MSMGERSKVRYAVVGAGNIARTAVLPSFVHAHENSELVAIVSSDREKRAALARTYHLTHTGPYEDLESLLHEARASAAYVAVPDTMHRDLSERIAHAGVHVLCEKPMATTEEDCHAMIEAAAEGHVKLMIGYRLHFEEANLTAIEIARSGRIGEPRIFDALLTRKVPANDGSLIGEAGGGALFDLGPYCINAARYLFREEPTEVAAMSVLGTGERSSEVDEATCALLRFSEGRIAQFSVSHGSAEVSCFRLIGTGGDLRIEPAAGYETELVHHLTVDGKTERRRFPRRDQFAAEIVYFSQCILDNREPEPSGWEGLADVRVLAAAARSAETGQLVSLPPFERSTRPDLGQNIEKPPLRWRHRLRAPTWH